MLMTPQHLCFLRNLSAAFHNCFSNGSSIFSFFFAMIISIFLFYKFIILIEVIKERIKKNINLCVLEDYNISLAIQAQASASAKAW